MLNFFDLTVKRKAHTNPLDVNELKRLYCDEGMTLRAIAAMYDVTFQAIHDRLVRAGIKRRKHHPFERPHIRKSLLEQLHLKDRLSVREIAQHLETSEYHVNKFMKLHEVPRLTQAQTSVYGKLSIGAAMELPKPKHRRFYSTLYGRAKNAGIRISVRTIDRKRIEVRRVA